MSLFETTPVVAATIARATVNQYGNSELAAPDRFQICCGGRQMPGLQESSVSLAAPFAPLESRQLGRAKMQRRTRDAPPLVSFTQISNMVHDVRLYYSPFQCSEQPGWGQPKFENERPARLVRGWLEICVTICHCCNQCLVCGRGH